eukprot:763959-Hanusia_phi.AAC.8
MAEWADPDGSSSFHEIRISCLQPPVLCYQPSESPPGPGRPGGGRPDPAIRSPGHAALPVPNDRPAVPGDRAGSLSDPASAAAPAGSVAGGRPVRSRARPAAAARPGGSPGPTG